jgi:hypothetical protein
MTTDIIVTVIEGKDGRRDIIEVIAPTPYLMTARYFRLAQSVRSGTHPALHGDIEPGQEAGVLERIFKDDYATWAGGRELAEILGSDGE